MHQLKEFRRKFRGFESLEIISNEILWNIGMKLLKSYEMVSYVPHSIEKQTLPLSLSLSLYTLSNSWKNYVFYFLWNIQSRVQLSNWVLDLNLQQYDFFCKIQSNFDKIYCLNLNSQIPFKISLRLLLLVETSKLHGFSLKKKNLD